MTAGRQPLSKTKDWCTPPYIVDSVRKVFRGEIELDPCSNQFSVVGARVEFKLPEHDGLAEDWTRFATIYVNPPYGSDKGRGTRILHWFSRIAEAAAAGSEVIALVPVATNTRHWKDHVFPTASAICFLYVPRLRFYIRGVEDRKGAPMAMAAIYYGPQVVKFALEFRQHGAVVPLADVVLPEPDLTLFGTGISPQP